MKKIIHILACATLAGALSATTAFSQATVRETTTTTSAGTISAFDPNTIVVKSETATEPITYKYTKTTTYVDETGAPVSMETVRSGLPVTVYYVKTGDDLVASKVVVRKTIDTAAPDTGDVVHKKTTVTTTTDK